MVFLRKVLLLALFLLIFGTSCTVQDWFTPGTETTSANDALPFLPLEQPSYPSPGEADTSLPEHSLEGKPVEEIASQLETDLLSLPEIPLVSKLEPEKTFIEPGMYASFQGHPNLSGDFWLRGPDGEALHGVFSSGRGSIAIPVDASAGLYTALVDTPAGAIAYGHVQVVNEPGLWVSADRVYISSQEVVEIHVAAYGLPEYALAGIGLGGADWKTFLSDFSTISPQPLIDEEGDIRREEILGDMLFDDLGPPLSILAPNERRVLTPSLTRFSSLDELMARSLLLPGFLAGYIQVFAVDARNIDQSGGAQIWLSNQLHLQECSQNGTITGQLNTPGDVYFVSPSKGYLGVNSFEAGTPFSLEMPPGNILVFVIYKNQVGPDITRSVLVEVPCGEEVMVSLPEKSSEGIGADSNNDSDSPGPSTYSGEHPSLISPLKRLGDNAEVCKRFLVHIESDQEELQSTASLLSHLLAGKLRERLKNASVHSLDSTRAVLRSAEIYSQDSNQGNAEILLRDLASAADIDFLVQGKLARVGDSYVLALSGRNQNKNVLITLDSGWFASLEDLAGLGDPGRNLIEKMVDAGVCGFIEASSDIQPGENVEVRIQVANLAGEAAEGALIEALPPSRGIIDPQKGTISAGVFTTNYMADPEELGLDQLSFDIRWEGKAGPVDRERLATSLTIAENYGMIGGFESSPVGFSLPGLFQGLHFNLTAYSCHSGKTGPYEGSITAGLALEQEGVLPEIVSGASIDIPITLSLPPEGGVVHLAKPFQSLTGRYHSGLSTMIFFSMGFPLFSAEMTALEPNGPCPEE